MENNNKKKTKQVEKFPLEIKFSIDYESVMINH